MGKSVTSEDISLGAQFDEVRSRLLDQRFADRLAKPLEFWVLPSDRRLPNALLDRTVGDLLSTPFDEISATPGIGEKKISSLVKLLDRATHDDPPQQSISSDSVKAGDTPKSPEVFDPLIVSEALWLEWRRAVGEAGLGDETLGWLAPSLQRLPTVIWHTPLAYYLDYSLSQVRQLRTHGEKRVRCVLEVFHSVYHRLHQDPSSDDSSRRTNGADSGLSERAFRTELAPPWIVQVEGWIDGQLAQPTLPTADELRAGFINPLLDLIRTDCGDTVFDLVNERLGIDGPQQSVRQQSKRLRVTRARIYQLLDDCSKVITVRWPSGRERLNLLIDHYSTLPGNHDDLRLFFQLSELCFPARELGHEMAAGPGNGRLEDLPAEEARHDVPLSAEGVTSDVPRSETPVIDRDVPTSDPEPTSIRIDGPRATQSISVSRDRPLSVDRNR